MSDFFDLVLLTAVPLPLALVFFVLSAPLVSFVVLGVEGLGVVMVMGELAGSILLGVTVWLRCGGCATVPASTGLIAP